MARPAPTTRARMEQATFTIRILTGDGKPANPTGLRGFKNGEFRLPIPPQSLDYSDQARTHVYAKQGGTAGADQKGMSPPVITITGTTAQGTRGGMDGYEWQKALENIVSWYASATEKNGRERRPLHVMEWHDTLNNQHWVVVPLGTPYGRRDATSPERAAYTLKLQALRRTTDPVRPPDLLGAALAHPEVCPLAPACAVAGNPFEPGCKYRGLA